MSRLVRIRCPICGFLGNQARLHAEHEFQVLIQQIIGRGRGKITHRYYEPESQDGVWLIKLALIDKLRAVANDLEREARSERKVAFQETLHGGTIVDAWAVSRVSSKEAVHCVSQVVGFTQSGVIFSLPSQAPGPAVVDVPGRKWQPPIFPAPMTELPHVEEGVPAEETVFSLGRPRVVGAANGSFSWAALRSRGASHKSLETKAEKGGDSDGIQTYVTGSEEEEPS